MNLNLRWRFLIVFASVVLAAWALSPTWRYYRLSLEQRAQIDPEKLEDMKSKALRLGLDLQGGMHMALELDDSKLEEGASAGDLMDRALEIVRNRIDQFGVTEPVVQRAGEKRIIVELAGIDDLERAQQIVSRAAVLEFKMVRPGQEARKLLERMDLELARRAGLPTVGDSAAPVEEPAAASGQDAQGLLTWMTEDLRTTSGRPLASRVQFAPRQGRVAVNEIAFVREEDFARVKAYVDLLAGGGRAIPPDVQWSWASDAEVDPTTGGRARYFYLLNSRPELTGALLDDARPQPDVSSSVAGNFLVEFDLDRQGRRLFTRTTGENVGRLMAIVLDGRVKSAPEIHEKIRGGTASITGSFTAQEATDLSVVLRAGALPVPLVIEEQRAVGPSLGRDSIELGSKAVLYGFLAVLLFMIVYYRVAGTIAVVALFLNIVLMLAIFVWLDAVLTLPGIAGFALTVGMSVDANVLIYERIREELRSGQTFRNAVSRGYSRAFMTIFDSNITTLFGALALLWFGTGPIKGFAITLSLGLVVSMFTALYVTRVIFDLLLRRAGVREIPV